MVSGDPLGGDCPAVKGPPRGADGGALGECGGRRRRGPARRRARASQPGGSGAAAVRSLKVVDRLKGYLRHGDTHTNEDPL